MNYLMLNIIYIRKGYLFIALFLLKLSTTNSTLLSKIYPTVDNFSRQNLTNYSIIKSINF
ncbi:hypothetical protein C4D26_11095 [Clostridium perfringens]